MLFRILWGFFYIFFRFSPRTFFGWRCFLLRSLGAKIGDNVHIYASATIYMPWNLEIGDWSSIGEHAFIYNLGKVTIGSKSTISHRAHLCAGTHDYSDPTLPLIKPPITICDQAWICADAFVGPDVTVGEGAVVGARAVVTKDVAPWTVVAGNPAKFIKNRDLKG
jgi:putative colanic acid biosynthesis acetyltransferase WcaF